MSENIQANKQNYKFEDSWDKLDNNQPFIKTINIPSELNYIQRRFTQFCNSDENGVDTNGKWNYVIKNYPPHSYQLNHQHPGMCCSIQVYSGYKSE